MKNLKNKILFIVILIMGFGINIQAQLFRSTSKVGTTAAEFLKINPGGRAVGMGGALTAIGSDLYSVYYNPAGIATATSPAQITFNHANWLAGMTYDFAAGALYIDGLGTLFSEITIFQVPEEKVRTFQHPEGDGRVWDANSFALSFGFARQLTDRFSIGFNAKYIYESIWHSSASTFAFDFGTLYRTPFNGLTIGASISNFGSTMRLDGRDIQFNYDPNGDINSGPNNIPSKFSTDDFELPLSFRIGFAMDLLKTRFIRFTAAVDAVHPNDNSEYLNTGAELAYNENFFIRAGYKSLFMNNAEGGLTYGAGLKYKINGAFKIYIDYGFADYGRLNNVQFFDIGLIF